jgi:hypothetical protein
MEMTVLNNEFIEALKRRGADVPNPSGIWELHASAAAAPDGALLFVGASGSGKSTICRLLIPYFSPLAEDVVYLVPALDGSWSVANAGYPQPVQPLKEEVKKLHSVPLKAIFILVKGEGIRLERLDALLGCRYLMDGFFEILRQNAFTLEVRRKGFSDIAAIARRYPAYRLVFNLSGRVIDLMVRYFGKNEQWHSLNGTKPAYSE